MTTVKEIHEALGALIKQNPSAANVDFHTSGNSGELFIFRDKYMGDIKSISFENENILNQYRNCIKKLLEEKNVNHYTTKQENFLLQMFLECRQDDQIEHFIDNKIIKQNFEPIPNYSMEIDSSMICVEDFMYHDDKNNFDSYLGTYFDVDRKFGIDTSSDEIQLNMYGIYNPATDEISVECTITFDDKPSETFTYIPTNNEKAVIYDAMNEYCLQEEGLSMKHYCKDFLIPEDTLMNFLKSEIPFRLNEILNLSADKDTIDALIAEVYAKSDVMFNYDRLDSFILSKHSELINEKPPLNDMLKDASTRTEPLVTAQGQIKENNKENIMKVNKQRERAARSV